MRISNLPLLLKITSIATTATAFVSPRIGNISNVKNHHDQIGNGPSTFSATTLHDFFIDHQGVVNFHTNDNNHNNENDLASNSNLSSNASPVATSSSSQFPRHENHNHNLDNSSHRRINHRHAAKDWLHNIASIPKSTVLKDIRNPVLSIASWSTLISIIHAVLSKSSTNSNLFQHIASKMCIGTQMHSLMISSLGLLLVFRTNSAYQRFVEGRKIWEQISGISRNLDRMVNLYSDEIGQSKVKRIKHYLASFPYLLRHHIRPSCLGCDDDTPIHNRIRMEELPDNDSEYLEYQQQPSYCWVDRRNLPWRLLDDSSLEECSNAINRPLWACNSIADEVMSVPYGPNFTSRERLTLIGQADKLSNAIGQCERIHQTAVPLNYARHALRSLTIWLFTLPFALVGNLGLLTGPICAITSWLMFGVYQIGHSIEDPFQKTLRLSLLCNAIRRDVLGGNRYRTGSAFSTVAPQALPEVIVTSPMASNSVLYDDSNIADSIHMTSMQ